MPSQSTLTVLDDRFWSFLRLLIESIHNQDRIIVNPDFHITLNELIYAPNVVTARWTIRATNTGPGKHPPTGKAIVVPGISILHISEGKIIDEWIAEAQ